MRRSLCVHTRRSNAPSGRFKESSVYRTRHTVRFRPFDPFDRDSTAFVVTVEYEVYDDDAAREATMREVERERRR